MNIEEGVQEVQQDEQQTHIKGSKQAEDLFKDGSVDTVGSKRISPIAC